jgi:hypothetical protein
MDPPFVFRVEHVERQVVRSNGTDQSDRYRYQSEIDRTAPNRVCHVVSFGESLAYVTG